MGKHLKKIMKEMCKRVNVNFKDIDFKKDRWFMKHSWTFKQENDFRKWLIDYLNNNSEARKEVLKNPNKKEVEKAVSWFIINYGWKYKNE